MGKKIDCFGFLLILILSSNLPSVWSLIPYTKPNDSRGLVETATTLNLQTNTFFYSLKIQNTPDSSQKVRCLYFPKTPEMVILQTPEKWDCFFNSGLISNFFDLNGVGTRIHQGETLEGISFKTPSPPAIVPFYTEGDVGIMQFEFGESPPLEEIYPEGWELTDDLFKGEMVGPEILTNNTPNFLISRLIQLEKKAFEKKWVKNGSLNSLFLGIMEDIQSKIQSGNNPGAIEKLNFLISKIELEEGGELTRNGFSLLKPNAEWIILKLGGIPAKKEN